MNTTVNKIAAIGLAIGAILGMSGLVFTAPVTQVILFVVSGVGFATGLISLAMKFFKENHELPAIGFLLFGIGEIILTLNSAGDSQTISSTFAGCMLFYVVGYCFILLPQKFAIWIRISGMLSAVLFLAAAIRFYLGYGIATSDPLPGMGYGLLTITIVGWILYLIREVNQQKISDKNPVQGYATFQRKAHT